MFGHIRHRLVAAIGLAALAACSSDSGGSAADIPADDVADVASDATEQGGAADAAGDVPDPPANAWPCTDSQYWPVTLASERFPVLVHFRPGEESVAAELLGYVETAWDVEVVQLGFSAPLPDGGACGPDDRFDVFIWGGIIESYVDVIDVNPDTSWDDWLSYLVVDPFGPYGGEVLDATVAHELNHACQAADDWWDSAIVFEMTATFMEDVVFDDDDSYLTILEDFQKHPDWSLDRNDDYRTWYMYSAALYLAFLREHVFEGDASFVAAMWRNLRNPPGAAGDPLLNEPDFADALDDLLVAEGTSYLESVVTFARWRWYTGGRDDGAHFEEGASFPAEAEIPLAADVSPAAGRVELTPAPMMLGNAYARVFSDTATSFSLELDTPDNPEVRWVVQALPGLEPGSDGELLDLSGGAVRVDLSDAGERIIIATALPTGEDDPDARTDKRYPVALVLAP